MLANASRRKIWICIVLTFALISGCRKKEPAQKVEKPKAAPTGVERHLQSHRPPSEQKRHIKKEYSSRPQPSKRQDWRIGHYTNGKTMVSTIWNQFPEKEDISPKGEFETTAAYRERKRARDQAYERKLQEFRDEWVGRILPFSTLAKVSGRFDADKSMYPRILATTPGSFPDFPEHMFTCETLYFDAPKGKVTASFYSGFCINTYNAKMTLEQAKRVRELSDNSQLYIKVKFKVKALTPAHENDWYKNRVTIEPVEVAFTDYDGKAVWFDAVG